MKYLLPLALLGAFLLSTGASAAPVAQSPEKQVRYLSGTDMNNTVSWDFYCTGGRRSGYWTTIQVPSCWEQQGFGTYNYGRDYNTYGKLFRFADEKGQYRHTFTVPSDWAGRKVCIVFEGSMTDTQVRINGQSAGGVHQGAFYQFRYDISDKLHYGAENTLEVTVSKMSSDHSVNRAERYADFWIFGGIYRPVYLESFPQEHIGRFAIDARADGSFSVDVFPENIAKKSKLTAEIFNGVDSLVGKVSVDVSPGDSLVNLRTLVKNAALWTSETPALHRLRLTLSQAGKTLYTTGDKFGFRTIEVKKGDGVYLNGVKIKFKGTNRHAFWPETGRTTSKEVDILDVMLHKQMNMNAVRCSHYPPDRSFLRVCDSLGLYVIDELAGWQDAYDTPVGEKLVREMIIRDVNHPSIIFWSNGNEGGTNKELDDDFLIYDKTRPVIHAHHRPGNDFNGIDCDHYEGYASLQDKLKSNLIYMPTEFLHAQNDGGGAAALEDYWELMWKSTLSAGGFIWAFVDEGLVRTDIGNDITSLGGPIDVVGPNAPDGILGPHREKEGSFYAAKEIFSPVYFPMKKIPTDFNGRLAVENRYHFTDLDKCSFSWKLVRFHTPGDAQSGYRSKDERDLPVFVLSPLGHAEIDLTLPCDWRTYDALVVTALDAKRNQIVERTWKIRSNEELNSDWLTFGQGSAVQVQEEGPKLTLKANGISVYFDKNTGALIGARNDNANAISFKNGPVLCGGTAVFEGMKHYQDGANYVVECRYKGDMKSVKWTMRPDGWLSLDYAYSLKGDYPLAGISFDYPEVNMMRVKYLGEGPLRVWKNRMQGVSFNVWEKLYNNSVTGLPPFQYPEFKGYYADVAWMQFDTAQGKFLVASKNDDMFVRLYDFHSVLLTDDPFPALPSGDISFLSCIPSAGAKGQKGASLGPSSEPNHLNGEYHNTLYFYFGGVIDPL